MITPSCSRTWKPPWFWIVTLPSPWHCVYNWSASSPRDNVYRTKMRYFTLPRQNLNRKINLHILQSKHGLWLVFLLLLSFMLIKPEWTADTNLITALSRPVKAAFLDATQSLQYTAHMTAACTLLSNLASHPAHPGSLSATTLTSLSLSQP